MRSLQIGRLACNAGSHMFERIGAIVGKEFSHVMAERRTLLIILLMPVAELLILGYAINTVVDHLPTIVVDAAQDAYSRDLVDALQNSSFFDVHGSASTPEEAVAAIDAGRVRTAVVIPEDYGRRLFRGHRATVQLLIDGSDPNVAQAALFAAESITQVHSASLSGALAERFGQPRPAGGIELRPSVLYNPSLVSVVFTVPGLVGVILQQWALGLTAEALVRERELGTLEQLNVTPVRPWEVLVGKCIPYVAISLFSAATTLAMARVIFGVEVVGSIPLLFAVSLLFLLGSLGTGLLISAVSRSQWQAKQIVDLFLLPAILLTGFVFPREAMPQIIQQISLLIPLTYFLQVLRGIFLKGVGLEVLWPHLVPLAIFGVVVFTLSALRFQKRAD
jgi:ABC-2 type transport system permease protein